MMWLLCGTCVQIILRPIFESESKRTDNTSQMSPLGQKSDIPIAPWIKFNFEHFFENFRNFFNLKKNFKIFDFFFKNFFDFNLSHKDLGMSDFCTMRFIWLVLSILFGSDSNIGRKVICTHVTHKRHIMQKTSIFVPVVCSSQCGWWMHIRHLTFRR